MPPKHNKPKLYGIRRGRHIGTLTTWEEARASVNGFKGALYKGFQTRLAADLYVNASSDPPPAMSDLFDFAQRVVDQRAAQRTPNLVERIPVWDSTPTVIKEMVDEYLDPGADLGHIAAMLEDCAPALLEAIPVRGRKRKSSSRQLQPGFNPEGFNNARQQANLK